jgi:hypothetical protein
VGPPATLEERLADYRAVRDAGSVLTQVYYLSPKNRPKTTFF